MKKLFFLKIALTMLIVNNTITLSCKKQNKWLDEKSVKNDIVPQTIADFQSLMDNTFYFNESTTAGQPGSDNSFMTDVDFDASTETNRNLYTWNESIWIGDRNSTWDLNFQVIQYANIILDGLQQTNPKMNDYDNVKGQALFHRAFAYYTLSQLFCKPYNISTKADLGLPIRKNSDVNIIVQRSNLDETYMQIINDLLQATELLSNNQPYIQRPTKAAAFALLAKTHFIMGDYKASGSFANKCLELNPQIMNFNNNLLIKYNSTFRFPINGKDNPEILFYSFSSQFRQVTASTSNRGYVNKELYDSYEENDLRKQLFYVITNENPKFRGGYTGDIPNFTGLATNEIYLIRAESYARNGNASMAMSDLNFLLNNRYKNGTYLIKSTSNPEEALYIILNERRKELPFTGNIRWEDLRRLNQDPRFQKIITRIVKGNTYVLTPNSNRYVLPIPNLEIIMSKLQQNER